MPPTIHPSTTRHTSHLLVTLFSVVSNHVPTLLDSLGLQRRAEGTSLHRLAKRAEEAHGTEKIVFAILIPVLVLLSGLFAGLTLGYMSLDETQLNVLSISGTEQQKLYANKIKPIRKNGHLLLVTLLLANMIVNETLPVIADPILGGGVQSVVVSTVLIVIFSEIIPQSICTRYGLAVGAKMAPLVRVLLYTIGIIAWPVAKLLEFTLGPHHGIIYRRSELKELINIHADAAAHGGDLKHDTVTIIGATLDLQEKDVKHAMTPIESVFMLSIDAVLDWETLRKICLTGHSRIPVYEEVVVPVGSEDGRTLRRERVKKIVGILLVKQCVLLDPSDSVPVRKMTLNKVPFVPQNEPLLGILDRFQEGRSHIAIVTRFSKEKAASVKQVVKESLTQRIRNRVGMGDTSSDGSSSSSSSSDEEDGASTRKWPKRRSKKAPSQSTLRSEPSSKSAPLGDAITKAGRRGRSRRKGSGNSGPDGDLEKGNVSQEQTKNRGSFQLPHVHGSGLEQSMPADAVLAKEGAEEILQSLDPAIAPLGIITLEDVLEELIGEEIYDEFDPEAAQVFSSFVPPADIPYGKPGAGKPILKRRGSAPQLHPMDKNEVPAPAPVAAPEPIRASKSATSTPALRPIAMPALPALPALPNLKNLSIFGTRSTSAPPTRRNSKKEKLGVDVPDAGSSPATTAGAKPAPAVPAEKRISEEGEHGIAAVATEKIPEIVLDAASPVQPTPVRASEAGHGLELRFAEPLNTDALPPPSSIPAGVATALGQPANSRSASPAPSLEAMLLTSKLRQQQREAASGVVGATSLKERIPSVSHKGTRFKSSPLTGDRNAAVTDRPLTARRHQGGDAELPEEGDHEVTNEKERTF